MPAPSNPFFDALTRQGFKRWYERQLLSSHAHLVLCVLSLMGLMGGFEAFSRVAQDALDKLVDLLAIAASGAIGTWSVREYARRMAQAEFVANQATCPDCGTYGRLRGHCATHEGAQVDCLKCGRRWEISA